MSTLMPYPTENLCLVPYDTFSFRRSHRLWHLYFESGGYPTAGVFYVLYLTVSLFTFLSLACCDIDLCIIYCSALF